MPYRGYGSASGFQANPLSTGTFDVGRFHGSASTLSAGGRSIGCVGYRLERNRQGLGNEIIEPDFGASEAGEVNCRERLGGLLRYYYREAA